VDEIGRDQDNLILIGWTSWQQSFLHIQMHTRRRRHKPMQWWTWRTQTQTDPNAHTQTQTDISTQMQNCIQCGQMQPKKMHSNAEIHLQLNTSGRLTFCMQTNADART